MKKIIIYTIFCLLLLTNVSAQWTLTEVMYNPLGSDSENEWIELVGPLIPPEIKFYEDGGSHSLHYKQGNCEENCTIIIADNSDIFLESYFLSSSVLLYDSSWSSLKNTGEEIGLKNETMTVLSEIYPAISSDGNSVHQNNFVWTNSFPTPGDTVELSAEVPEFGTLTAFLVLNALGIIIYNLRRTKK